MNMDAIKDIIPRVIGPLSKKEITPGDIVAAWQRLAGGTKTSCVAAFKDGYLTIHVDSATRLMKMNLQKADYLDDLKSKWPDIKDIRFKVGKIVY